MTPTRHWIAAGAEPAARPPLFAGWLRRLAASPEADVWVLRGSLVTAAYCPGARAAVDIDYLLPLTAREFDAPALDAAVRAIAARPDPSTTLMIAGTEVIWAETDSPGLRAFVEGEAAGGARTRFQIDTAVGEPMIVAPRAIIAAGVPGVRACAAETLFGWKVHSLCEFGRGRWRAKDLYDADLLWRHAGLDLAATRAALELAFSSKALPLTVLDDFRTRAAWGRSRGGVRKWRTLKAVHPSVEDFLETRARVRAAVDVVLGPADLARHP